jgi:hypothetical protein
MPADVLMASGYCPQCENSVREAALWAVLHQGHDRDGLLFVDGGSVHSRTGDSRGEMGVGS